jgi:hypothetical protein
VQGISEGGMSDLDRGTSEHGTQHTRSASHPTSGGTRTRSATGVNSRTSLVEKHNGIGVV